MSSVPDMTTEKDDVKKAINIVSQAFSDQDYGTALTLLKPLADAGIAEAVGMLGLAYHRGAGVKPDGIKAVELFEKAIEMGDALAAYNLSLLYEQGMAGVDVDVEMSRHFFRLSEEMGLQTNELG